MVVSLIKLFEPFRPATHACPLFGKVRPSFQWLVSSGFWRHLGLVVRPAPSLFLSVKKGLANSNEIVCIRLRSTAFVHRASTQGARQLCRTSPSCGNRSAALGLGTRCLERPDRGWLLPFCRVVFPAEANSSLNEPFSRPSEQQELAARLARGETAYLAGISIGGFHNSGVALIEVSPDAGLRIICNNEEERFSGRKHANNYPSASLEALTDIMRRLGISPEQIVAWLGTYDYPLLVATGIRCVLEEFPASMHLMFQDPSPTFDKNQFKEGICAPVRLGQLFGLASAVSIIGMPHHDNHAWFSYLVSPFARDPQPVMISVVVDGSGDFASISFYVGENGTIRQIRTNGSVFDSLGMFYSVISSSQGGWTALSSEGRYMGAAAYGDMNRSTNRFD